MRQREARNLGSEHAWHLQKQHFQEADMAHSGRFLGKTGDCGHVTKKSFEWNL